VPHEASWWTHRPEQVRAMHALPKEIGIAGAIPNQYFTRTSAEPDREL
jgi:hypothetical protein